MAEAVRIAECEHKIAELERKVGHRLPLERAVIGACIVLALTGVPEIVLKHQPRRSGQLSVRHCQGRDRHHRKCKHANDCDRGDPHFLPWRFHRFAMVLNARPARSSGARFQKSSAALPL